GVNQALLPDLDAPGFGAERFHHAERLVPQGKGRHAAALLDVKALAAAQVEEAFPDVQVGVTHARARYAHQHFAALRLRRGGQHLLQRLAVLDDLVADHAFPASCSAWSMSQRMSSSVSMPTDMRIMSGVTPALMRSA